MLTGASAHAAKPHVDSEQKSSGMQIEPQAEQADQCADPAAQADAEEEMDFGPARPPAASASDPTVDHSSRSDSSSSSSVAVAAPATTTAVALQPGIRRVKVYALNAASRWDDQGTGHVSYVNMRTHRRWDLLDARNHDHDPPDSNEFRIVVSSETPSSSATPELILSHALSQGYDYQVQGLTILQWTRQDTNTEVALSFQDTPFCVEAWRILAEQLSLIDRLSLMQATQLQQYQQQQADPASQSAAQHPSADEVIMGGLDADIVCGPGLSDDYALSQDVLSQHDAQQDELSARRLPDDHPDAPPVTIDSLDKLAYRLHNQRISRRELLEIIQIWRDKEAEFEKLLEADRAAFAIEQAAIASQQLPAAALSPTWRAATSSPPRGSTSPSRSASATAAAAAAAAAAASGSSSLTTSPPLSAALVNRSSAALQAFTAASGGSSSPTPRSPFSTLLMQVYSQLHSLFRVVKYLLLLNDVEIFEFLFSDTHIGDLIGILEYDPVWSEHPVRGLAPGQQCRDFHTHRAFIECARFKHVLDFHDEVVTHKVHQSYKILYLKDVVLFNHLDDATSSTFTQILFVNQMSIIQRLTESAKFMNDMFAALNAFAGMDRGTHEKKQQEAQRLERQQTQLLTTEGRGLSAGSNTSVEAEGGSQTPATQPLSQPLSATSSAPMLPEADASMAQLAAASSDNSAASAAATSAAAAAAASGNVSPAPSASDSASAASGAVGSSASCPSSPSLHSLLLFLQELVLMAKSVQIPVRDAFYKVLDANALFEVLEAILARDEERKRAARRKRQKDAGVAAAEHSDSDFEHDAPSAAAAAVPAPSAASRGSSPDGSSSDGMLGRNWLWLISTDIISNICIHDASLFRNYLISTFRETTSPTAAAAAAAAGSRKPETSSILSMVFRCMTSAHLSTSLAHQMSCLIRLVLDPEAMSQQDQVTFLGRVYKHPMMLRRLIQPLKQFQPTSAEETPFDDPEGTLLQITQRARARQAKEAHTAKYHLAAYHSIELLSYCALHHNLGSSPASTPAPVESPESAATAEADAEPLNYFRAFCLEHSVLPLVINSLRRTRRNDLVCSAIRFFRICIGSKDAAYTRIICDGKLFAPIFLHFAQNGSRYNLLNSVVCEIIHFFNATSQRARPDDRVDNYNPQSLHFLRHIITAENYWSRFHLDRIQYVKTFQQSKQILAEAERENEQMRAAGAADGVPAASASSSARASRKPEHFAFEHLSQSNNMEDDDDEVKPIPTRITVSRTTHSILSDSDEDEEDDAAANAAAAMQQQAAAAAAAAVAQAQRAARKQRERERAGKDKHVSGSRSLARRQARRARQEAEKLQLQQMQQQQFQQQQPSAPLPQPDSFAAEDADPDSDAGLLNYDDSSSSSSPDSVTAHTEEDEETTESAAAAAAAAAASSVPVRRIVFVSSEGDGAIKRQPLPHSLQPLSPPMHSHSASTAAAAARRMSASKNKRKLGEVDAMTVTSPPPAAAGASASAAASGSSPSSRSPVLSFVSPPSSATPSPPLSLHSPPPQHPGHASAHMSPSKHNPYLHVPPSELPPTAQRSPELKPVGVPLPAASSSLPDHPAPNSPPRQLTTLDLAEDCDAHAAHEVESRSSAAGAMHASGRSLSLGSMGAMLAHSSVSSSPPALALSASSSSSPPLTDGSALHATPPSSSVSHHARGTLFATLAASNAQMPHTMMHHADDEDASRSPPIEAASKRRKTLESAH